MNKCEKCGFLHYRTDPCRKPLSGGSSEVEHRPSKSSVVGSNPTRRSKESTVRENMPAIDGVSAAERVELEDSASSAKQPVDRVAGSSSGRTAPFDGVKTGSNPVPASKFDKVAYQRAYMAKYRRGEVGNKYRQPLPKQYD